MSPGAGRGLLGACALLYCYARHSQHWAFDRGCFCERGEKAMHLSSSPCSPSLSFLPLSGVMIINKPFLSYCCGCKHFTRIAQLLRVLPLCT